MEKLIKLIFVILQDLFVFHLDAHLFKNLIISLSRISTKSNDYTYKSKSVHPKILRIFSCCFMLTTIMRMLCVCDMLDLQSSWTIIQWRCMYSSVDYKNIYLCLCFTVSFIWNLRLTVIWYTLCMTSHVIKCIDEDYINL